jgi:ribosomal protein S18 acetylase RimI-like enzyme
MKFDPAAALRVRHNERLRRAQGWADYHDVGGALVITSEAPVTGLNCVLDFTATERQVAYLLDMGFALLRAFDRPPAVELTPLDRPLALDKQLAARHLRRNGGSLAMVHAGEIAGAAANPEVDVWTATPDDARTFAEIHAAGGWAKKLSLRTTLGAMLDEGNTFYIAHIDGQPAGTLHVLCDEDHVAGIYALSTVRAQRRRGVARALMLRAIADARNAGCDLVCLGTDVANGGAQRLFGSLGFETLYESQFWTE